ncbi:MAG TPA: stress protein [Thermoanaerobaculia bacterium]|nr:stress protein [Thermoanaerobaculia bacterium]
MSEPSFGARIRECSVEDVLALERGYAPAAVHAQLDGILSGIIRSSLDGTRVAVTREAVKPYDTVELLTLAEADRAVIAKAFDLAAQQGRGAWFLPDEAHLNVGWANMPHHFGRYERFATGIARDESGKVRFQASPEALYFWSVLNPLFDLLYRPFQLRGATPPSQDRDEQRHAWEEIDRTYDALGLPVAEGLAAMRFGSGWSKLRRAEQLVAKRALLTALRASAPFDIGARYRVWVTQELLAKYYAKTSRGVPTMRKVLTKPLQRTLAGFFGGDWLSFLAYIGETPSSDEQISTALPEPRLYVGAASRAKEVAARHGVPAEEVERMLAAFWTSSTTESPVHQRIRVLREYWEHFEDAHARQAPGMQPLWGFADDDSAVRLRGLDDSQTGPPWYHPGQYRAVLPASLLADIARLWSGVFMPSAPDRIVTAIGPYGGMLAAFGPALRFWDGVGLTAWFVSEGPMSRTDMAGLEKYHERDIGALNVLGCPIDAKMFAELVAAENTLGSPEPITDPKHSSKINAGGITISMTMNVGSRREGFVRLRDIVTNYRRAWATKFLDAYLRARWESEIRLAAREYNRHIEVKRKAPTAKQFAKFAEAPANHWFGGDVSLLYAAFGEKSPVATQRARLLPSDTQAFALRVFEAIGGTKTSWSAFAYETDGPERERRQAEWNAHWKRKDLAEASIRYVQLREALGRQPSITEFGRSKFEYLGIALHDDPEEAWKAYTRAVDNLLAL